MTLRDDLQTALGSTHTIESELGGGGMSRVFVAEESSLGRKVVVKVLPPEMTGAVSIDRFRREIQLAAQLQHPHIVPLLTAGEAAGLPYFTMPFVRGESLRARLAKGGELPVSETVRILREVASALAYAHENNIVHRDIKPENVLISGGSAVVTDFGVAKALSASSGAGGSSLTSMGVALGTPAYMAPEQATADPSIDHRADIYALGVMAYEMLTGSTPFTGRNPQATLAAHVTEKPDAVTNRRATVPPMLASLVMSCLEKRPADRPQTASDVMHELDALSTPSGGLPPTTQPNAATRQSSGRKLAMIAGGVAVIAVIAIAAMKLGQSTSAPATTRNAPFIAVIPFENVGRPEGSEFTDGITEEITSRLSALTGLKVIGRQTSKSYAGTDKTPQQIATELGVNYILTGTVRWDRSSDGSDMVRVSPALLRTSDATQVWGAPYQTVLSGIFEVQSKVATEVANALNVALLAPEKDALETKPTDNVEAYGFYLRGNELVRNSTEASGLFSAVEALERAVELDPNFALAHARLSVGHTELYWFRGDRTPQRLRLAKASAEKALALDPNLAAGHMALGIYHYHGGLNYDDAVKELSIAERIRPNDAETLFFMAAIQRRQGKWRESISNMLRAIDIEPRLGLNMSDLAQTHIALREWDAAERLSDRALIVSPGDVDAFQRKADATIGRDGDVTKAVKILRQRFDGNANSDNAAFVALISGWPASVDPVMRNAMERVTWIPVMGDKATFMTAKMFMFHLAGDTERTRAYADSAAVVIRAHIRESPDDAQYHSLLARAYAMLGNRKESLAAADRSVKLLPMSTDAYGAPDIQLARAIALMQLGDHDQAVAELERLLRIPSVVNKNWLRLNPIFQPLRNNQRFQRLTS